MEALLLLPLLQQAAFSSSKECKQWAGHALSLLAGLSAGSGSQTSKQGCSTADQSQLHGAAAAVRIAEQLLARLWQSPLEARHWLASLHLSLTAASSSSSRGDVSKLSKDQQQLDPCTLMVVSSVLQHPAAAVQQAALRGLVAAMAATPLLGLSLLPLLVHQLQQQVERFLSGEQHRRSLLLAATAAAAVWALHAPLALQ